MNILLVVRYFAQPHGVEQIIIHLSRSLVQRGHNVRVLTFSPVKLGHYLDEAGVTYRQIRPTPTIKRPWIFRETAQQIVQSCADFQPDVIHSHWSHWAVTHIATQWAAERLSVPHVASLHTSYFRPIDDLVSGHPAWHPRRVAVDLWMGCQRIACRRWLRRPNTVFAVASRITARQAARELGVPPETIHVIPNAIDPAKYQPTIWLQPESTPPTEPILLAVARLDWAKALDILIQAVALPELASRPLRLWLVGRGPLEAELKSLVSQLGQEQRVTFLGTRFDLPEVLAQAHLFVHPARLESFGIAPLDAMVAGLPIIISDSVGMKEILPPEHGVIVPTDDPPALARAVAALLDDPAGCRQQAQRLHTLAQQFSYDRMTDRYIQLYQDCITNLSS